MLRPFTCPYVLAVSISKKLTSAPVSCFTTNPPDPSPPDSMPHANERPDEEARWTRTVAAGRGACRPPDSNQLRRSEFDLTTTGRLPHLGRPRRSCDSIRTNETVVALNRRLRPRGTAVVSSIAMASPDGAERLNVQLDDAVRSTRLVVPDSRARHWTLRCAAAIGLRRRHSTIERTRICGQPQQGDDGCGESVLDDESVERWRAAIVPVHTTQAGEWIDTIIAVPDCPTARLPDCPTARCRRQRRTERAR